jgi:hypothetical protein
MVVAMNDPSMKNRLKYLNLPDPNSVKLEDLEKDEAVPNKKVSIAQ